MRNKYKYTYNLKDNQTPAIIDLETGEVTSLESVEIPNNDTVKYKAMKTYIRFNQPCWLYLEKIVDSIEYKAANKLALLAEACTSSLIPYSDETSAVELSKDLGINRNKVKKVMNRLIDVGVIGKLEIGDSTFKRHSYWIFNPYLAFNGDRIHEDVLSLFSSTVFAKLAS